MKYRILIADDAAMNRLLIKNILTKSLVDIECIEAIHGREVLDIMAHKAIDLLILDLIMPVLDGYETLKLLKKNPKTQDIPVIVNSAITEIKSIEETLKEGAVDYFTKPLSTNDMTIILPLKAKNALLMHEQRQTIIELNRHINDELKNANAFANIMLPKANTFKNIELFIKYHPSLGIGGDFFDCVEENGRIHFMVADVTGHGIAAGMASSMVKILYRKSIEKKGIQPHEILQDMNDSIFKYFDFAGKDNYIVFTAFVGIIENNLLSYSNAGQPYPLLYHEESRLFSTIEQNGFLVGMMEDMEYESEQIQLQANDFLFLYTDGLFCTGEGHDFTAWDKVKILSNHLIPALEHPDDFLEELFYSFHMVHKANHTDFTDDVAMMLIKLH
ncbi:MAG: SpoIIE family protein phosphatase [Vallitaleaceae bacterium]|nr:SpoIIE family protein phosphatase [Vallitaleaceae bacterium]